MKNLILTSLIVLGFVFPRGVKASAINDLNNIRQNLGEQRLQEVQYIDSGAILRAIYINKSGQWSHFGWDVAMRATIRYPSRVLAGENLARDCYSDNWVIGAWMDSPTHKQNMLNPVFKYAGFARYNGICVLWLSEKP